MLAKNDIMFLVEVLQTILIHLFDQLLLNFNTDQSVTELSLCFDVVNLFSTFLFGFLIGHPYQRLKGHIKLIAPWILEEKKQTQSIELLES